jgi:hypothetical protein
MLLYPVVQVIQEAVFQTGCSDPSFYVCRFPYDDPLYVRQRRQRRRRLRRRQQSPQGAWSNSDDLAEVMKKHKHTSFLAAKSDTHSSSNAKLWMPKRLRLLISRAGFPPPLTMLASGLDEEEEKRERKEK